MPRVPASSSTWITVAVALALPVRLTFAPSIIVTDPPLPPTGFEGVVRSAESPPVPVPDTSIHMRSMDHTDPFGTKGRLRTDASGAFHVHGLAPGLYALRIEAEGHTPRDDASVQVVQEAMTQVDIRLKPLPPEPEQDMSYVIVMLGGLVVLLVVMFRGHRRTRQMRHERESLERWRPRTFPSDRSRDDGET